MDREESARYIARRILELFAGERIISADDVEVRKQSRKD
jgi:hypothetical protein